MAKHVFLDFEKDVEQFDEKIEELKALAENTAESKKAVSIDKEIRDLEKKSLSLLKKIYVDLTPWQISQVARHPNRPYTLDYISAMFSSFYELHGDRAFADDPAIVGGLARLADMNVVVIGNQKGRTIRERTQRNFGMARPEGYRKALRLMKLAEKYDLPVITFVDTPGAYPGIDAEERGQSEAIGRNIYELSTLRVPVIACIIGEGGSGGALAIGVADRVLMLQYATYSVISPEGCASILWKSASEAPRAAEALALTAPRLEKLGLIDRIVSEPLGGAHRDPALMATNLQKVLIDELRSLLKVSRSTLLKRRMTRIEHFGSFAVDKEKAAAEAEAAAEKGEKPVRAAAEPAKAPEAEVKEPAKDAAKAKKPAKSRSKATDGENA